MKNGYFITFEGGEGVGKTTQISILADALKSQGHDVVTTREPGGTPHAEAIRNLLSDPELGKGFHPEAEAYMFTAARHMHVQDVIKPALEAGKIVLCDRYADSTYVYQGHVQGLNMNLLDDLITKSSDGCLPNLTLVFDLTAEEGLKRVQARGVRDHYDEQDADFYDQIRQGFLKQAEQNKDRCVIVDASRSIDDIAADISTIVTERLIDV